jgi:hypothetical protein
MLKNKNILIISPQSWGRIRVSKHHYAEELARRGNRIFFLNPISTQAGFEIKYSEVAENKNIQLITIKVPAPYALKFKARQVYKRLLKFQLARIIKKLPQIDILWDFDGTDMFEDYSIFKSKLNILHPVDNNQSEEFCKRINAHVGFSLAPIIVKKIEEQGIPVHFINHGVHLSTVEDISYSSKKSDFIKVGYVGNLLIPSIDHEIFSQIITENPNVEFHMIGPYEQKPNNIASNVKLSSDILNWISFLKSSQNVKLYGHKSPTEFLEIMKDFDVFILVYSLKKDINAGQNSHKILEYLSTGKIIVSNYVIVYDEEEYKNLIAMNSKESPNEQVQLFKNIIQNLDFYNSLELQKKRKHLALDNSYPKQVDRIEKILLNYTDEA